MNEWQRWVEQLKKSFSQWSEKAFRKDGKEKKESRPNLKMCPICRNLVDSGAKTCEYCQADLEPKPQRLPRLGGGNTIDPFNPVMVIFFVCILFQFVAIFLSTKMADYELAKGLGTPHLEVLARMGGNPGRHTILNGELWRTCTYMFLHGGIFHIIFNLMALAQLGPLTLNNFGLRRFWLISFATGIAGGLLSASSWLLGFSSPVSIGFSGALFGYLGINYIFFKKHGPYALAERFKKFMIWGNVIFIFLTASNIMNIDNFAHMGGMLAGMGLGLAFETRFFKFLSPRVEQMLVGAFVLLWCYGLYKSFLYVNAFFG